MINATEAKQKSDNCLKRQEKVNKILSFIEQQIIQETEQGSYQFYLSYSQLFNLDDAQIVKVLNTLREHGYEVMEYRGDIMEPGITGFKIMWK